MDGPDLTTSRAQGRERIAPARDRARATHVDRPIKIGRSRSRYVADRMRAPALQDDAATRKWPDRVFRVLPRAGRRRGSALLAEFRVSCSVELFNMF